MMFDLRFSFYKYLSLVKCYQNSIKIIWPTSAIFTEKQHIQIIYSIGINENYRLNNRLLHINI